MAQYMLSEGSTHPAVKSVQLPRTVRAAVKKLIDQYGEKANRVISRIVTLITALFALFGVAGTISLLFPGSIRPLAHMPWTLIWITLAGAFSLYLLALLQWHLRVRSPTKTSPETLVLLTLLPYYAFYSIYIWRNSSFATRQATPFLLLSFLALTIMFASLYALDATNISWDSCESKWSWWNLLGESIAFSLACASLSGQTNGTRAKTTRGKMLTSTQSLLSLLILSVMIPKLLGAPSIH